MLRAAGSDALGWEAGEWRRREECVSCEWLKRRTSGRKRRHQKKESHTDLSQPKVLGNIVGPGKAI